MQQYGIEGGALSRVIEIDYKIIFQTIFHKTYVVIHTCRESATL